MKVIDTVVVDKAKNLMQHIDVSIPADQYSYI